MFAEKSEEDTYILPSSFDELRQFLNLPPVTEIDSLFENMTSFVFFSASSLTTSTAFEMINAANFFTHEDESAVHKAFMFYPTQIDEPILQTLPNDPRALNMLCHRQVTKQEGNEE